MVAATGNYLDLVRSLGVRLGVGITGQEDINSTVILVEGFGQLQMREHVFQALKALEGRQASINGATQIRRVPSVRKSWPPSPTTVRHRASPGTAGHRNGGEGVHLRARLDGGEVVTIPRANVEIIEEE